MSTISLLPLVNFGVDQAIVLLDLDRDDAAFANVAVIGKIRFLDDARARRENDVEIFVPGFIDNVRAGAGFLGLDADGRGDFLVGAQLEKVRDGAALGRAAHLRNLVNFFDVGAP